MDTRKKILERIRESGPSSGAELARFLGISRQAVNRHIRSLVESGIVVRTGETRGAQYHLADSTTVREPSQVSFSRRYSLKGLEEDRVFDEVSIILNLTAALNDSAFQIVRYAFTELLNNAIDHSQSQYAEVRMHLTPYDLEFTVRDFGIGLFWNIAESYSLKNEYESIGWVMQGKKTTLPDRHAGEGLFFTTKVGDRICIRSHALLLDFQNSRQDIITGEVSHLKGTEVVFSIKRRTQRSLKDLFDAYAPQAYEYRFSRTRVYVTLSQQHYMSRSEGKRLVSGLDGFREVVFDFRGVYSIGQAFSDEVFRHYRQQHPDLVIRIEHANPAVMQMLKHVGIDNSFFDFVDN